MTVRFMIRSVRKLGDSYMSQVNAAIATSKSYKEVLVSLGFSTGSKSTNNLINWCNLNKVDTGHFAHRQQTPGIYSFPGVSNEEFLEVAKNSCSVSDVCRTYNIPPTGWYHRSARLKLKDLEFDFTSFLKRPTTPGSWSKCISDEVFFSKGKLRDGQSLKKRLIKTGTVDVCSKCGLGPVWQGEYITIQVDHIDGDPTNNVRHNLRLLCPNCHSQTPTFSGKSSSLAKRAGIITSAAKDGRNYLCMPSLKEKKVKGLKIPRGCSSCGIAITRKSKKGLCPACSKVSLRKVIRPSKEWLEEQLTGKRSFLAVGNLLGVSDQAVRKWCRRLGMDVKKMGRAAILRESIPSPIQID